MVSIFQQQPEQDLGPTSPPQICCYYLSSWVTVKWMAEVISDATRTKTAMKNTDDCKTLRTEPCYSNFHVWWYFQTKMSASHWLQPISQNKKPNYLVSGLYNLFFAQIYLSSILFCLVCTLACQSFRERLTHVENWKLKKKNIIVISHNNTNFKLFFMI